MGQNQQSVPFWVGAPPIFVYFSEDWDAHLGYGILTHGQMANADPGCLCYLRWLERKGLRGQLLQIYSGMHPVMGRKFPFGALTAKSQKSTSTYHWHKTGAPLIWLCVFGFETSE